MTKQIYIENREKKTVTKTQNFRSPISSIIGLVLFAITYLKTIEIA